MKLTAYSVRKDELDFFHKFSEKYQVELTLRREAPTPETLEAAKGCSSISMLTTPMTEDLLRLCQEAGIRFISTRSIGYDHIDVDAAKRLGVHVGNVSYSPASVADYAVMMLLAATRKFKAIARRTAVQDYSLSGVRGLELHNLTVGVLGTGRIGRAVIRRLSGFGCRILAYDLYESDEAKQFASYVPLDRLLRESDAITLHMPATDDNYHLINADTLAEMKDGVLIVNTARGSLIDTDALIDAVESGKVGAASLDVIENETGLYYSSQKNRIIKNRELILLESYPNVIVTPHTAFYTDQAVSDMVEHSIESCVLFEKREKNPWQVV